MSDACIQHLHTHRWPYWHDFRGGRTEPEDLVGGDTQSGPGSDLASQAGRRRSCWPASAARERSQPSGAGAGIGAAGGKLLRGRVRRILAASAVDRGGPRVVRIVRVPSREQEDARRDSRERQRLVKEQTGHTNRIKALLRLLGMAAGNPRRRDWLTWLARQRDWEGQPVPPRLVAELKREHARLLVVCEQLQALSKAPAPGDVPMAAARMAEHKANLRRLKSLGPAFAGTLTDEVFYKDFDNVRQVAS